MIIMVNYNPVSEGGYHDVTMEITISAEFSGHLC